MFTVLVLDTNGLKEANLHLAEQQKDQFEAQAVLKITPGAIWECSRAGKGQIQPAGPQNHLGGNWTATGVWIKEGLCSRESSAPSVCVSCVSVLFELCWCNVFIKIGHYLLFSAYLRNYKHVLSWPKRKTRNQITDLLLFS